MVYFEFKSPSCSSNARVKSSDLQVASSQVKSENPQVKEPPWQMDRIKTMIEDKNALCKFFFKKKKCKFMFICVAFLIQKNRGNNFFKGKEILSQIRDEI